MRLYTVHVRHHGLDPDRDIVLVKEGFCWPVFFFTLAWAIWHRLWGMALAMAGLSIVASGLTYALAPDPVSEAAIGLALAGAIGFVANDARRRKLTRAGHAFEAVIAASDLEAAEFEFANRSAGVARPTAIWRSGLPA